MKFKVLQLINMNPKLTSREIAQKVETSNGTTHYLLISLIDQGFLKNIKLNKNTKKINHHFLTPKGVREKSLLALKTLSRKKKEFKILKNRSLCWKKLQANNYPSSNVTFCKTSVTELMFAMKWPGCYLVSQEKKRHLKL